MIITVEGNLRQNETYVDHPNGFASLYRGEVATIVDFLTSIWPTD